MSHLRRAVATLVASVTLFGLTAPDAQALGVLGGLAPNPKPLMPASHRLIAPTTFKTLPFENSNGNATKSVLDMRGTTTRDVWLAYNFNTAPIPDNKCKLANIDKMTTKQLVAASDAYTSCLMNSWKPWFTANKLTVPRVRALSCELEKNDWCDAPNAPAAAGSNFRLYLDRGVKETYDTAGFEKMLSHETGHMLQHAVRVTRDDWTPSALYVGVVDPDYLRYSRRLELQAECLSIAMLQKTRHRTYAQLVNDGLVIGADEIHWGQRSIEFWAKQAATAKTAGSCNAMVADNSLLTYGQYGQ